MSVRQTYCWLRSVICWQVGSQYGEESAAQGDASVQVWCSRWWRCRRGSWGRCFLPHCRMACCQVCLLSMHADLLITYNLWHGVDFTKLEYLTVWACMQYGQAILHPEKGLSQHPIIPTCAWYCWWYQVDFSMYSIMNVWQSSLIGPIWLGYSASREVWEWAVVAIP